MNHFVDLLLDVLGSTLDLFPCRSNVFRDALACVGDSACGDLAETDSKLTADRLENRRYLLRHEVHSGVGELHGTEQLEIVPPFCMQRSQLGAPASSCSATAATSPGPGAKQPPSMSSVVIC